MSKEVVKKAEAVACPKCRAYPGMPCRAGSGYGDPHPARVEKVAEVVKG